MKPADSILFVGAHCDDVELLAGGLLAKACRSGRRVGVLVFSDHSGVVDEARAARARSELEENLAWLREAFDANLENHCDRFLPACRGDFQRERGYLFERMESLRDRYEWIVTHPAGDTNQDHRQVAEEAARVFKAHGSLLGGEFPANDLGDFTANVYIELDPIDLDAKVRLVGNYRSQQFGGRPYFDESAIRGLAAVRGSQIRTAAAEAFAAVRLRVRD